MNQIGWESITILIRCSPSYSHRERGGERERTLKFPGTGHVIRVFWQPLGEKKKKERKNARKRACFVFRARFEDVLVALDQVSPRSGYF